MSISLTNHELITQRFLKDGDVETAINSAVQSALQVHRLQKNPIPVYENGKVILVLLADQAEASNGVETLQ